MAEEFDKQQAPAPDDQPEKKKARPGAALFEWLQMLIICILSAVILFNCFARLTRVDGSSMENTLTHGELMWVWSLGYTPKQGDVVVLNKTTVPIPGWDGKLAIVKRVVAVGGQSVDIDYVSGTVYVDGNVLDEPYIKEEMSYPGNPYMEQTHWDIPEGSVFVMGDNRNNSTDSRDERVGPVDTGYILGKGVMALWPISKFGFM